MLLFCLPRALHSFCHCLALLSLSCPSGKGPENRLHSPRCTDPLSPQSPLTSYEPRGSLLKPNLFYSGPELGLSGQTACSPFNPMNQVPLSHKIHTHIHNKYIIHNRYMHIQIHTHIDTYRQTQTHTHTHLTAELLILYQFDSFYGKRYQDSGNMLFYFYDSQNTSQSVQNWCSELVKLTINKAEVAEAWNLGRSISTLKHE